MDEAGIITSTVYGTYFYKISGYIHTKLTNIMQQGENV
jgi:hypothetical protein